MVARPVGPAVRWRNNYFARNKEALPCCGRGPSCQPLHVQSTSDGSRSLTTLTTLRREHQGGGRRRGLGRGRRGAGEDVAVEARAERSTRVHLFGCGVRLPSPQGLASGGNSRGSEASAAAQPAMGGRSMRHDRRCFGRLEQEDQRLKKHYGRWMDIVRSVELESCILTKLTKPSVPVSLVGPQVSLPLYWVPASRGSIHFFCA